MNNLERGALIGSLLDPGGFARAFLYLMAFVMFANMFIDHREDGPHEWIGYGLGGLFALFLAILFRPQTWRWLLRFWKAFWRLTK